MVELSVAACTERHRSRDLRTLPMYAGCYDQDVFSAFFGILLVSRHVVAQLSSLSKTVHSTSCVLKKVSIIMPLAFIRACNSLLHQTPATCARESHKNCGTTNLRISAVQSLKPICKAYCIHRDCTSVSGDYGPHTLDDSLPPAGSMSGLRTASLHSTV